MSNIGVKVLDNTRDERGDLPSFMLYRLDADMNEVEVATLDFNAAETLMEALEFHIDVENKALDIKYGEYEDDVL